MTGIIFVITFLSASFSVRASTVYDSPYVTLAPDGKAWTTNAGDQNYKWYNKGTAETTGIASSIPALQKGEHYYTYGRTGAIPIGRWEVIHDKINCCHDEYPDIRIKEYHGVSFGREICLRRHHSGWNAYCADCATPISDALIYMTKEAAASIDYFEVGTGMDYFYLCAFCNNLEQGTSFDVHICKAISYNRYKVRYDGNFPTNTGGGYMLDSFHMYNNATEYNGAIVTPVTHLSKNTYTVVGYEFVEWNTEPDGSGQSFADEAEILNLAVGDWNEDRENGKVTLYAQWRKSSGTLNIDPGDGTYNGRHGITSVQQEYLSRYTVDGRLLKTPAGHTVSFDAKGGKQVSAITGTSHFVEWKQSSPFAGDFTNGIYTFKVSDGNVDTLTAVYEPDAIVLPGVTKPGSSFGGWYYDPECTKPAGGVGDRITPTKDMTLYADWVDLTLNAKDNYAANGGKGAVNLSWAQSDHNNKSYKLYQSRDNATWKLITSANDIGNQSTVSKDFAYTGSSKKYTIPYSGIYTLTAYGAQGANYGAYKGGYGGSVTMKLWLEKGEIITYNIGGSNGYNGGGTGSVYGNGGGATTVTSNKKGTLLIAGGGGSASANGNGGAGGSSAGLRADDSAAGANGQAGGGGGYVGGNAGEQILHHHQSGVCPYHEHTGNTSVQGGCYQTSVITQGTCTYVDKGWRYDYNQSKVCHTCGETVSATFECHWYGHSACGGGDGHSGKSICPQGHVTQRWGTFQSGTHIYDIQSYALSCGVSEGWHCSYTEGQVVSSKPAYGGSNYVNTAVVASYSQNAGARAGNGSFRIRSETIGYLDELSLNNVLAPDIAAPDSINADLVGKQALQKGRIKVTWTEPKDNGTDYYHRAESYLKGNNTVLCKSNITKNTLISGIKGYYYILNQSANTTVTASSGTFLNTASLNVALAASQVQYLHIAAVDKAGNVGKTVHIPIDSVSGGEDKIAWSLYTQQLTIDSGDNVHPATEADTYYVRSDGVTPYTLRFQSYMDGTARSDYQINYSVFETDYSGEGSARNIIYTPNYAISSGSILSEAENLSFSVSGSPIMQWGGYTTTERSNRNSDLYTTQQFVLDHDANGKRIRVTPISGADFGSKAVYSDIAADRNHCITLIGDGEAPVIRGTELLENAELINRNEGSVVLNITATDDLSGIRDFYLEITNADNGGKKKYMPDANGNIKVEITNDEPIFSGDFKVRVYAADNVGNETEVTYGTTEFALSASIERILEPHDPVFKCGESGILTITTWGYADRIEVEFPAEFVALNPGLDTTYVYTEEPQYKQEEQLQFMVPLDTPANTDYTITVRAYKGDKRLEEHPSLSAIAVNGSVLDEFRTRLR